MEHQDQGRLLSLSCLCVTGLSLHLKGEFHVEGLTSQTGTDLPDSCLPRSRGVGGSQSPQAWPHACPEAVLWHFRPLHAIHLEGWAGASQVK